MVADDLSRLTKVELESDGKLLSTEQVKPMLWINSLRHLMTSNKHRQQKRSRQPSAWLSTESLERRTLLTIPAPVILTEFEDSGISDAVGKLTWEVEQGVDRYEYWVSQLGHGQIATGISSGQNYAFVNMAYGDWHRVWVRGINEDGTGPWGPAFTQIVGSELPPRPNIEQWDGDQIYTTDTTPEFTWDYSIRARDYDVWVEKDGSPGAFLRFGLENSTSQSDGGNQWTSETELEDGVYRVWVRARNANGVSAWSQVSRRAVGGEQPIVTGTTDSAQNLRPTINWSEGVQSVNYELWVSSEATNQRVLFLSGLTTNSYTPNEDLPAGIYKAWVRQTPQVGAALPWSEMVRIEVGQDTIPGTPNVAATPDPSGETYHENLLLNWDAVSNGGQYEIWVSQITTGERVIFETTSETSYAIDLDLLPDFGTFRAWVRAIGTDSTSGSWSEYRQFDVVTFSDGRHRVEVIGG